MMKLRIWHNSNFGASGYERDVSSVREAVTLLGVLAEYDLYLGDLIVSNAQGVMCLHDGEWVDRERDYDLNDEETWICQEDPAGCI